MRRISASFGGRRVNERTARPDLLSQAEVSRDDLLHVAVDLARRLRAVAPEEAEKAALEVNGTRRGMGESSLLAVQVTAQVLSLVEDALRLPSEDVSVQLFVKKGDIE